MKEKNKYYALKISGILIIIYLMQVLLEGSTELFLLTPEALSGEVWRFITSIFLHGGLAHLAYNIFALALFGTILESMIGSKKFITTYLVTGILANIISVNYYPASLGASGAIFGVIGALILIRPLLVVWAFGLPMPIFIAGILWAIGDAIGIFIPDGVGNIAHLSGMAFGLILGVFLKNKKGSGRTNKKKKKNKMVIDERTMRNWERNYMR